MRIALILLALILGAMPAKAQTAPGSALDDENAKRLVLLALDNIQRGQCESAFSCAPATEEEKANPPLTLAEAKIVIDRAALSSIGEHCGLDWRRENLEPMMSYWRVTQQKNERQMVLIAILHGIMQGAVQRELKTKGACTDEQRHRMQARLPFRP